MNPKPYLGTHPGVIRERTNTWAPPKPMGPTVAGWDAEQIRRIVQLADRFGIETPEAFLWAGYLAGETHVMPSVYLAHPAHGDRAVA